MSQICRLMKFWIGDLLLARSRRRRPSRTEVVVEEEDEGLEGVEGSEEEG